MDLVTAILDWMKQYAARMAVGFVHSYGDNKREGVEDAGIITDIAQPFFVATMSVNIQRPQRGHIVSATIAAWGHLKSSCNLAGKIVRQRDVYITLLAPMPYYEKTLKEVALQFKPGVEDHLRKLIRVIGIECNPIPTDTAVLKQNIISNYRKIVSGEPLERTPGSGEFVDDFGKPQLVLLDFFLHDVMRGIRDMSGRTVPIYAFQSGSAPGTLFLFGPEHLGGNGDLAEKLKVVVDLDGEKKDEEAEKIYRRVKNEVVRLPGLPPMYDYEHYPQKWVMNADIAFMSGTAFRLFEECDGIIMNSSPALEGEAIKAYKSWMGNRPVISPGPLDYPIVELEPDRSADALEVMAFMDNMLKKHGSKSLVYISFGSFWWTTESEKVWAAIDVLIELGIPFLFSHASPFANIPPEVLEKIKSSELGYHASWLPQREILKHEACGWFITHCGHNSMMEAFSAGVPLICWPFEVDQPSNAANVAFVHNMGYELFETRSGYGLLPVHRLGNRAPVATVDTLKEELRDVLKKAMGEDGEVKRENVRKFREGCVESWSPGGGNWKEVEKITAILKVEE